MEFDGLRARQSLTLAGLSEKQPIYTSTDPGNHSIRDYMLQIVNEGDRAPIRLTGMGMILLDEIVQTSKTRIEVVKKNLRDFYMREALNYIEGNYMHDLSIEEIADASGLNRSYFSRIFKETFSLSPQRFLLQYRMNKAAELLKYSQLSINAVSSSVGYENQLHFSRAFKNVFAVSPSEYRDTHHIQSSVSQRIPFGNPDD